VPWAYSKENFHGKRSSVSL